MSDKIEKVVIVGSGCAGLTAAIYAARANLAPICIEGGGMNSKPGEGPGGQLMMTSDVENYPGFPEGIMGPELVKRFRAQAERFGTRMMTGQIIEADLNSKPKRIVVEDELREVKTEILCHTIILATGASARLLGLEDETKYMGQGVTTCATCDGAFFKDRPVAVIGGGDSALEEALFLTRYSPKVTLIHRREQFRASKIMYDRLVAHEKVDIKINRVVTGIVKGKPFLSKLILAGTNEDEGVTEELEAHGMFVAIGHTPNTKVFRDQLETDAAGYLITQGASSRTGTPGVFAAGDVHDNHYRQAITASGSGCKAAIDAERWLESNELG